jgi:hypothetical protein
MNFTKQSPSRTKTSKKWKLKREKPHKHCHYILLNEEEIKRRNEHLQNAIIKEVEALNKDLTKQELLQRCEATKERLKVDPTAGETMWRITKRITNSLEEQKTTWTTALRKSITDEINRAHSSSDWPYFRHVWNNANKAVDLRMSYEDLKQIVTWHFDENIADKQHILEDLWALTIVYAKKEKEHLHQTEWEDLLKTEFTREVDRAARHHTQRDYKYATLKAFQRIGRDINLRWLKDFQISGETLNDPYKLEDIWVTVHRYLQQEDETITHI